MSYHATFNKEVIPVLQKNLGIKNRMAVPKFSKITLNVGIGTLTKNTKDFSDVLNNVAKISGQKP